MADVNLGHVTSYAYAKSKGYTGTEDQYAQAMKDVTDAISESQQAAETATSAASTATDAAETASTKADQVNTALGRVVSLDSQRFSKSYSYDASSTVTTLVFNPTNYSYNSSDEFSIYHNGSKLVDSDFSVAQTTGATTATITITGGLSVVNGDVIEAVCDTYVTMSTDTTLAVSGAAADSKTVGDEISGIKEDLSDITQETWEDISIIYETGRINTGSVGSTLNPTRVSSTSFDSAICECRRGDVFKVTGAGGDSGRLWCFCDANYIVQSRSDAYITETDLEVTAPTNGYFVSNAGHDLYILKKQMLEVVVPDAYSDYPTWKATVNNNINVIVDRIGTMGYYAASASDTDLDSIKVGWTRYTSSALNIPTSEPGWVVVLHRASNSMRQLAITDSNRLFVRKLELGTWGSWVEFASSNSVQQLLENKFSSGENWSSNIVPDHGTTTEYAPISTYNPTLSQLYDLYDALVAAYPDYIAKTDLGTDQSGNYHLYKYSFVPESIVVTGTGSFTIPDMPKILLGSGTHGNGQDAGDEPEMVVGTYYLMKNICDNWYNNDALTYLRHNVQIELIPVQNPWGYVNKSRRNSRGVDINRNFPFGWTLGTYGNNDYGGTEPLSEAESVIIKNFIDSNTDALFYLDLHTTGGTQDQDKMIYYSMLTNEKLIVPANDTVNYLSAKWNHENIANLDTTIMHGYIHSAGSAGQGQIYQWVNATKGIPACVMEAFPNFVDSGISKNSDLVMRMCQDELVTFIMKTIRFMKFNYLAN